MKKLACAATVLAVFCVDLAVMAQVASPGHHRYYFDQQLPLTLNVATIAVFQADAGSALAANGMPDFDITPEQVTASPVAGWSLVSLSEPAEDEADIAQLVAAVAAAAGVDFVSPVFIDDNGGPLIVGRDIIVGFHARIDAEQARMILDESNAGVITDVDWTGMPGVYRLRSDSRNGFEVLDAANTLARRAEVRMAEPDFMFTGRASHIPNDPGFPNCWGIHNTGQAGGTPDMDMDGPEVWDTTTGDATVIVVVLDTGVQQDHPDINQVPGTDTTSDGPGTGDPVNACDNHGTPVAGCVSAIIDNFIGTVGIAPGCKSASARTFISNLQCDGSWSSFSSWTVNSLAWAEAIGARVSNNSNGYGFSSSAIATKYQQTRGNGMVHFASAGNDGNNFLTYPSSLPTVNAVTAVDRNGTLAFFPNNNFANTGAGLAFAAPGLEVYTTDRTGSAGWTSGDYTFAWGTSFASPYAAGVAALVATVIPTASSAEIEAILASACVDIGAPGYDTTYGWGFVNADNAVCPPGTNDSCSTPLAVSEGSFPFTTMCNTTDGLPVFCDGGAGGVTFDDDTWFLYTPSCTAEVTFSACNAADFDTRIALYFEGSCPPSAPLICSDDAAECGVTSEITWLVTPLLNYLVRVGATAGGGTGTLTISCPVVNPCPWDCAAPDDGVVGINDFLQLLADWGAAGDCDFDGGGVGINDFLELLANWGPCP